MPSTSKNIFFELTEAFNASERIAVLASGQAVVWYRLAMMSKHGDWIVSETDAARRKPRDVLAERGARYRAGAPLDPRWLAGGWSSHFEFKDASGRRVRCDFFSRPPRLSPEVLAELFAEPEPERDPPVVDVESLILMKQTQRAKDYPVIGELARRLPPQREIELTTDPDRILDLVSEHGAGSQRPAVRAAADGRGRLAVVVALAEEIDRLQQQDRKRVERYERATTAYRDAVRRLEREDLRLPEGHERLRDLAVRWLPVTVAGEGSADR